MRTEKKQNGFTLMEMLIVIALIAVLVAIAIPAIASQLERSREAADLANVRAAYAQVSAEALLGDPQFKVTVDLKQKQADWQSVNPVNIGGIVHYKNQEDTDNWKGVAAPNGTCTVSYDKDHGIILTWSGKASAYPFNTNVTNFFQSLYDTEFWKNGEMKDKDNFEFDSRCPKSNYVPAIVNEIGKLHNSLLQQEGCTWAYLGNGKDGQEANRYLFWTSLNTNTVGAGESIPVIIQTGDEKYYVSETTTGQRSNKSYVTVSKSLGAAGYKKILENGEKYPTLEAAYDAYLVALNSSKYDALRKAAQE